MDATTRRTVLAAAAVCAPAAAFTAIAEQDANLAPGADSHPAWLARIMELRSEINSNRSLTKEEADELFDRECELEDALYETPARTLDGVRAQLAGAVAAVEAGSFNPEIEGMGLRTALAALDGMLATGRA